MNIEKIKELLQDMDRYHLCMRTKEDLELFEIRITQMLKELNGIS